MPSSPDEPAPQRVVGVEHDDLGLGEFEYGAYTDNPARDLARSLGREWEARSIPVAKIEEAFTTYLLQDLIEVEEQ